MLVVPFKALCFSAPIGMILYLAWVATRGRSEVDPTQVEAMTMIAATALISFALALSAQVQARRR